MECWGLAITGLAGGFIISAGVFALITSTKLMSRLAGKTHTGAYVKMYEEVVILGGTLFNVVYVKEMNLSELLSDSLFGNKIAIGIVMLFSLFSGIFIGCLAVALAEALKATAIFSRRVNLNRGMSIIILSVATGKVAGALFQFFAGM